MLISANLYPWDVDADPGAADRIAGLGLAEVTLAAAYHAVRAVTPFHPRHRIVTRDAAVHYRTNQAAWHTSPLRPAEAGPAGAFERAAARLRASGLRVNAWAVLAHGCGAVAGDLSCCVRNAYGDSYPWALCIGSPAVRGYAAALAAEVASLADADAIELEACGWYGVDHGSAHDKTGEAAGAAARWLLSVCFCPACAGAYGQAGADPEELRAAVAPPGSRIAASLLAVAGLGGRPDTLTEQAEAVRAAGATELRLYHAGLASASDLAAIRALCRDWA